MSPNSFGADALAVFDGMTLSYVYENDWAFTNVFEGATRITEVEGRGTLREHVEIRRVAADSYFIAWVDDEMGPITQLVDLAAKTLLVSVLMDGKTEIWRGTITAYEGRSA